MCTENAAFLPVYSFYSPYALKYSYRLHTLIFGRGGQGLDLLPISDYNDAMT